jgi:hypothetical protein
MTGQPFDPRHEQVDQLPQPPRGEQFGRIVAQIATALDRRVEELLLEAGLQHLGRVLTGVGIRSNQMQHFRIEALRVGQQPRDALVLGTRVARPQRRREAGRRAIRRHVAELAQPEEHRGADGAQQRVRGHDGVRYATRGFAPTRRNQR